MSAFHANEVLYLDSFALFNLVNIRFSFACLIRIREGHERLLTRSSFVYSFHILAPLDKKGPSDILIDQEIIENKKKKIKKC